ncbi:ECT2 [Mytilus coruscus]|uniref:ECT2 n=1 Tax=Mytilus coruscus TaxID=42192 RepID=A0A6J8DXE1_MYTCO|nr:ECT2 [Mytilus coruscus]
MISDTKDSCKVVLVGKDTQNNEKLKTTLQELKITYVNSEDGLDCVQDASEWDTAFVLENFEGHVFHKLHKAETWIVGPPIIFQCAIDKKPIPQHTRPLFCTAMQGVIVCFTGFSKREEVSPLADLIHHMGGSVRKDISPKVTHLVANCIDGFKYRFAVGYGTPIMDAKWIYRVWEERNTLGVKATDEKMMQHRMPPFYKCCLCFYGFSDEEKKHMEELTIENGGTFAAVGDDDCSHLVYDDQQVKDIPVNLLDNTNFYVVRGEWFWGSIQMEACADETLYEYHQKIDFNGVNGNIFMPGRNMSGSKSRKRKRLKENIAQLAADGEYDSPFKRRSTDRVSMSPNSFLDASNTPDKSDVFSESVESYKEKIPKMSPRLQVVTELLQTEKNYVGILHTVINTFKTEIEKSNQYNGAILGAQEVKLIFGNIPPIYEVHCKIRDRLSQIVDNWKEEVSVGDIFIEHAEALMKAYPPFVNFFEQTKETIAKSDKTNPRFHAFLKVCLSKPECGRQSLTELLIRPVQRLPSVSLLLNDILKHTTKDNPDYTKVEKALQVAKEVMTHINEDKRKTENQVVMFDIMNDIDNCPATLLSSHRRFVSKIDVIELSDELCGKGLPMSLFLFTDSVEMCKRRSKYTTSMKSPATHKTPQKPFKHLVMIPLPTIKRVLDCNETEVLIPLPTIKRVLDCNETEDCRNAFGLICKSTLDTKGTSSKLYSFMVDSEETTKKEFVTSVGKSIVNLNCVSDYDSLVLSVEGKDLQISTSEVERKTHTLSRAARLGKRVSRAFSFNKTPKLKRAVSSISHAFSPGVHPSPGGDLRGKRLASCADLTEVSPTLSTFSSYPSTMTLYEDPDSVSLDCYSLKDSND